jgi:hypothetical protein
VFTLISCCAVCNALLGNKPTTHHTVTRDNVRERKWRCFGQGELCSCRRATPWEPPVSKTLRPWCPKRSAALDGTSSMPSAFQSIQRCSTVSELRRWLDLQSSSAVPPLLTSPIARTQFCRCEIVDKPCMEHEWDSATFNKKNAVRIIRHGDGAHATHRQGVLLVTRDEALFVPSD